MAPDESPTPRGDRPLFFRLMARVEAADHDVVDMVSGNPDWEPPPALRAGLRAYADGDPDAFQYAPSEGLGALRSEIADRRGVAADRVVVTHGAGEANHILTACALAERGEEVVIADPIYPYYADRTRLLGGDLVTVPVDADGRLDPAAVADRLSADTAAVVINSPNNPTGAVYGGQIKQAIAESCADYDALVISDEVYDHFDYAGRFESALAVGEPDHVAVTNGFSKSMGITGWRVGYAIVPDGLVDPIRTRHMLTTVSTTRPGQVAVLRALRETPPVYFAETRARLQARIETFTDGLDVTGATYTTPEGSFYVMAQFPDFPGTLANIRTLLDEAGVAGMPGDAFGDSRADWIRFSLTTDRVETAADRLASFLG